MKAWIADVRRAVFRLEAIGATITEEDHVLVLTSGLGSGLPPSYEQFIITLDATPEDELTLDLVHKRLLNEASRQNPAGLAPAESALAAAARPRIRTPIEQITCFNCGQKGHYKVNCP
ncbi:hypothetical protein C8Q76DRAFT_599039, partial [Earliella scabrosa]